MFLNRLKIESSLMESSSISLSKACLLSMISWYYWRRDFITGPKHSLSNIWWMALTTMVLLAIMCYITFMLSIVVFMNISENMGLTKFFGFDWNVSNFNLIVIKNVRSLLKYKCFYDFSEDNIDISFRKSVEALNKTFPDYILLFKIPFLKFSKNTCSLLLVISHSLLFFLLFLQPPFIHFR